MVILQAFYWNCHKDWWRELLPLAKEISVKGFDKVWLPPMTQGMNGNDSMGYDIATHYNLNTRFGNRYDLRKLINELHRYNVDVLADIVMGHMVGGELEFNPLLSEYEEDVRTWTKFREDHFPKDFRHFCHNCGRCDSNNEFGETICYYSDDAYMKKGLISWSHWLIDNIGFDGFRVDNCKDIRWDFLKEWKEEFGNRFTMGEMWSGNIDRIDDFRYETNIEALNFPMFYSLRDMCMDTNFDISTLDDLTYRGMVNFVSNHDIGRTEGAYTDDIVDNKELAYAYLMFQNEPVVVFWKDYFTYDLKDKLDELIKINNADSTNKLLYKDKDLYVKEKAGRVLVLNSGNDIRAWKNKKIKPQSYILL
jgi:alpha-amylase